MSKLPYTFITGMGRSGTTFLSRLLSLDHDFLVKHESIGSREFLLASWYLGKRYSLPYLRIEKLKIDKERENRSFIDVNGYLADSVYELKEVFDEPQIFHLVRNPLETCRSLLIRRDDKRMHKIPKQENEVEDWLKMNKLEQICINWKQTTEDLLKTDATLIRFEDLINSYSYCQEKLFKPLNIKISERKYIENKVKKVNKTRSRIYRYLYAKWKGKNYIAVSSNYKLSDREKEIVLKICRDTMLKLGYTS